MGGRDERHVNVGGLGGKDGQALVRKKGRKERHRLLSKYDRTEEEEEEEDARWFSYSVVGSLSLLPYGSGFLFRFSAMYVQVLIGRR